VSDPTLIRQQANILLARTFALVRACPAGHVTTYSWLAKALGYPRGARMLGWIMNEAIEGVPAQRVLNSQGELSGSWAFGSPNHMHELLEEDGIAFLEDGRVDLKRYGWDPNIVLTPEEREQLFADADQQPVHASPRLVNLLMYDKASPLRAAQP
jgi:methylated-DNA-protein-cysteine methyltransferase related protein